MANFSAANVMNQYYQSGSATSSFYDASQGAWQQAMGTATSNTQSQQNQSMSQSQLDLYATSTGVNSGGSASGYGYSNQTSLSYGQQDYTTGVFDSNISMGIGNSNAGLSATQSMNFGNAVGGSGNFGNHFGSNNATSTSGQTNGNFDNNMGGNYGGGTSAGGHYGTFGSNGSMASFFSGDMVGNFGTAFGNSMMGFVGQNLYQGSVSWDGDGGYYAAPVDNLQNFDKKDSSFKGKKWVGKDRQEFYGQRFPHQNYLGQMWGSIDDGDGKKGKNRKTAGLQPGVRFNAQNEKVVDVEIPLQTFSRWGHLRKYFHKRDTEVAQHLMELHDMFCEECYERDEKKRQQKEGKKQTQEKEETSEGTAEDKEETTEEEAEIRRIMGFNSFNTPRGTMMKGNQIEKNDVCRQDDVVKTGTDDNTLDAAIQPVAMTENTPQTEAETKQPFIGPVQPAGLSDVSETVPAETVAGCGDSEMHDAPEVWGQDERLEAQQESEESKGLTEEEKAVMMKLGWSVFNNKKVEAEENNDDDNDDDDDDDDDDENDGGSKKETSGTEELPGEWKTPTELENKES